MRIWFKMMKGTHLIKDMTIWLDANVEEFKRHAKTRFTQDCFIEHVDFDFLEMHVIEED